MEYDTINSMKKEDLLLEQLIAYGKAGNYPFHMPGHKRKAEFPNPYLIDITEIEGFDNLHHAEGMLKDSMEWAASVYHADKTYYLVNGSSSGVLSSICTVTNTGGRILISRNAHKSAYHGIILNRLHVEYCYPQNIPQLGIQGGILPADVERILNNHSDIEAVLIVSPTYDGIVSDICAIAKIVHNKNIPLIVDEAHGAHFPFYQSFPDSALSAGADIVIQSLHKTLSAFTQTAVIHVKKDRIDTKKLERYLQIFQSSSPSYVFMAGIEKCIFDMTQKGYTGFNIFTKNLFGMRSQLTQLKNLKIAARSLCGSYGVFDLDESKIVISTLGCIVNTEFGPLYGEMLGTWLRNDYHLEMEMCAAYTVSAITSWLDTREDLQRLADALLAIDKTLTAVESPKNLSIQWETVMKEPGLVMAEAFECQSENRLLNRCEGLVSTEFIYLYPPGIPILAPGETVTKEIISLINYYIRMGLPVQGMDDRSNQSLKVITERRQGV